MRGSEFEAKTARVGRSNLSETVFNTFPPNTKLKISPIAPNQMTLRFETVAAVSRHGHGTVPASMLLSLNQRTHFNSRCCGMSQTEHAHCWQGGLVASKRIESLSPRPTEPFWLMMFSQVPSCQASMCTCNVSVQFIPPIPYESQQCKNIVINLDQAISALMPNCCQSERFQ